MPNPLLVRGTSPGMKQPNPKPHLMLNEDKIFRAEAFSYMRRMVMTRCTVPALTALLNGAIDAIEKL